MMTAVNHTPSQQLGVPLGPFAPVPHPPSLMTPYSALWGGCTMRQRQVAGPSNAYFFQQLVVGFIMDVVQVGAGFSFGHGVGEDIMDDGIMDDDMH